MHSYAFICILHSYAAYTRLKSFNIVVSDLCPLYPEEQLTAQSEAPESALTLAKMSFLEVMVFLCIFCNVETVI